MALQGRTLEARRCQKAPPRRIINYVVAGSVATSKHSRPPADRVRGRLSATSHERAEQRAHDDQGGDRDPPPEARPGPAVDGVPHDREPTHDDRRVHEVEWIGRSTDRQREDQPGERGRGREEQLDEDDAVDQEPRWIVPAAGQRPGRDHHERRGHGQPGEQRVNGRHQTHGNAAATRSPARASRSSLRPLAGWIAISLISGAFVAALAPQFVASPTVAQSGNTVTNDAATLYLQNCASCHGAQGQGTSAGPSLRGVGAAAADFYLSTGRMPLGAPGQRPIRQTPKFNQEQIAGLVAYVASFGGGPAIPQVATGGDVHRGFELYNANCAACHAATGAGNAVGGGFFAVGLSQATDQQIGEAMLAGPGVMPKFAITGADRDSLVAYIRYLRTAPTPGGAPIGGIGPVAEGFVAVVIGLSAFVLAAVFVGRRRGDTTIAEGGAGEPT